VAYGEINTASAWRQLSSAAALAGGSIRRTAAKRRQRSAWRRRPAGGGIGGGAASAIAVSGQRGGGWRQRREKRPQTPPASKAAKWRSILLSMCVSSQYGLLSLTAFWPAIWLLLCVVWNDYCNLCYYSCICYCVMTCIDDDITWYSDIIVWYCYSDWYWYLFTLHLFIDIVIILIDKLLRKVMFYY